MKPNAKSTFSCRRVPPCRSRGSLLITVLAIIALAAVILVALIEESTDKIKYQALAYRRDDLRAQAYSWLETTLAVIYEIQQIDNALYAPSQGWGSTQAILWHAQIESPEDSQIRIQIEDESAKIPLNNAPPEALSFLFEEMEFDLDEVQTLVDSLLDWIDEDEDLARINGAEEDYYGSRDPPYSAANGPIQSWDELRLIQGFGTLFFDPETGLPNSKMKELRSAASLHIFDTVNVNTADRLVLDTLGRLEGFDADALYEHLGRDDDDPNASFDGILRDYDSNLLGSESVLSGFEVSILRITIGINRGPARFELTAVVSPGSDRPGSTLQAPSLNEDIRTERREIPEIEYPFIFLEIGENLGESSLNANNG